MPQFLDSAEPPAVSPVATAAVLPSAGLTASAFGSTVFSELTHCAWLYPCRYHTPDVAIDSVRLRASVPGCGFTVRLSHSQPQTGLSRRFPSPPVCPIKLTGRLAPLRYNGQPHSTTARQARRAIAGNARHLCRALNWNARHFGPCQGGPICAAHSVAKRDTPSAHSHRMRDTPSRNTRAGHTWATAIIDPDTMPCA